MKKAMSLLFVALAWLNPDTSWSQYPQVDFVFGYLPFDRSCEGWTKQPIDQSWYDELRAQLPAFRAEWSKEAPILLGETIAALNAPFRRNELTAFITLCPIQSMSNPLIINGRPFLPSPMKQSPWPLSSFSVIVFHEILHTHLPPLYAGKSKLLAKYRDETPVARNHLHLFSVMKHIYLKLGREQQLSEIVTIDSSGNDPSYARAWEIVNKIEGHEPFLKELRGADTKH
jgi:hypothetical protein